MGVRDNPRLLLLSDGGDDEMTITAIQQGDKFFLPVRIKEGDTYITTENADGVRVKIGTFLDAWNSGASENDLAYGEITGTMSDYVLLGTYTTLTALQEAVTTPEDGDLYGVGDTIYKYDEDTTSWVEVTEPPQIFVWEFPVTQDRSLSLKSGEVPMQVQIKRNETVRGSKTANVWIDTSVITEEW